MTTTNAVPARDGRSKPKRKPSIPRYRDWAELVRGALRQAGHRWNNREMYRAWNAGMSPIEAYDLIAKAANARKMASQAGTTTTSKETADGR